MKRKRSSRLKTAIEKFAIKLMEDAETKEMSYSDKVSILEKATKSLLAIDKIAPEQEEETSFKNLMEGLNGKSTKTVDSGDTGGA